MLCRVFSYLFNVFFSLFPRLFRVVFVFVRVFAFVCVFFRGRVFRVFVFHVFSCFEVSNYIVIANLRLHGLHLFF